MAKKCVSHKNVMKKLEEILDSPRKKHKIINKELNIVLDKIVNKIIIKHARVEAMKLLKLSTQEEIGEFLYHYHSNSHNICCMVIDSIKDRLHEEKKLPNKIGNNFGLACNLGLTNYE